MTWTFQPFPAAATVTQPQVVAVGQATETDTANAVAWAPKNRLAAIAVETDTANAVAWSPKTRVIAQVTETDTAQTVIRNKARTVATPPSAITCVELTHGSDSDTSSSATTASITAVANRLYIVGVQADNASGAPGTISVSGAGLTWEEIATTTFDTIASATARVSLFRAVGVGSGALTLSSTSGEDFFVWGVYEITNVELGANGDGAIVQSATNRTNSAGSLTVTLAALDASGENAVLIFGGSSSVPTYTPEASWTELTDHFGVTANFLASTTDNTAVIDPTGTSALAAVAVELRFASGREKDTALPIAWAPKNRLAAQITETGTAQAITRVKSKAIGQPSETETANTVIRQTVQIVDAAQATETDTANAVAWAPKRRLISQITETDTSQAISRLVSVAGVTHATGGALGDTTSFNTSSFSFSAGEVAYMAVFFWIYGDTETTISCPSWTKIGNTVLVGTYYALQVTLLRRVGAFSGAQTVSLGTTIGAYRYQCIKVTGTVSPYERQSKGGNNGTGAKGTSLTVTFDSTPASNSPILSLLSDWDLTTLTPRTGHSALYNNNDGNIGTCAITFRSTTDTAVGVTSSGNAWLGAFGVELAVTPPAITIGQATETDLSQSVSHSKTKTVGQAVETDLSQTVTARKTKAVGQSAETDLSQGVTANRAKTVAQATETDIAQLVSRTRIVSAAQSTETDLSQATTARKTKEVGQVVETSFAHNVVRPGVVSQVLETDLSQSAIARKTKTVGQGSETDFSQSVSLLKTKTISQIVETDLAQSASSRKTSTVGQSAETDLSQSITAVTSTVVAQATETDLAQSVTKRKVKAIALATETDTAPAVTLSGLVPTLGAHLKLVVTYGDGPGVHSFTTGAIDTQASGSVFVLFIGRGVISEHVIPTDNKGNTYVQIGTAHAYTNWSSSGTAVYACAGGTGGSGHTWTVGRNSNDDEISIVVVEIKNATRVAQHDWREELVASTNTTDALTVAQPSVLLTAAYGDGTYGQTHGVTPSTGWAELQEVSHDAFVVQISVAAREESSGTFSCTWTYDITDEGAQLWILSVDAAKVVKAVGQASETDTATHVLYDIVLGISQPSEADSAQSVTRSKTRTLAQVTETETAQAVTKRKLRSIGQPSETETSQTTTAKRLYAVGQPSETDLAQAVTKQKTRAVVQSSETDTSQVITRKKVRAVSQPSETDVAQVVSRIKTRSVSQIIETDTAQATTRRKTRNVVQATETDTANSVTSQTFQTITAGTSITSGEAFGTASVALQLGPSSVTSLEAFGSSTLTLSLALSAISSLEAVSTPSLLTILSTASIASAELFGNSLLHLAIQATGVGSLEAFGAPVISALIIQAVAISSLEAFGSSAVTAGSRIETIGIISAEQLGTGALTLHLNTAAIASLEAFGSSLVLLILQPSSVASLEAFGTTAEVQAPRIITPAGIASQEVLGAPSVALVLGPQAVASLETFGNTTLIHFINATGIGSGEVLGTPAPILSLAPSSIASVEVFGAVIVMRLITPISIPSPEAFGSITLSVQAIILPVSTQSQEAFGEAGLLAFDVVVGEEISPPTITVRTGGTISSPAVSHATVSSDPKPR